MTTGAHLILIPGGEELFQEKVHLRRVRNTEIRVFSEDFHNAGTTLGSIAHLRYGGTYAGRRAYGYGIG